MDAERIADLEWQERGGGDPDAFDPASSARVKAELARFREASRALVRVLKAESRLELYASRRTTPAEKERKALGCLLAGAVEIMRRDYDDAEESELLEEAM